MADDRGNGECLGLTSSRTVEECIAKAKEITNKQQNDLKRKKMKRPEKYKKELARKAEKSISKIPRQRLCSQQQLTKPKQQKQKQKQLLQRQKQPQQEQRLKLRPLKKHVLQL